MFTMLRNLILTLALLCGTVQAAAKTCYLKANGNWSSDAGVWVTTDGGAVASAHPVAGDTVYANANSNGCTNLYLDANAACLTFVCNYNASNWTGCFNYQTSGSVAHNLTITGSLTYSTTMTTAGAGALVVTGTSTLTSGAITHSGGLTLSYTGTTTLSGAWVVSGALTANTGNQVLNASTLSCLGLTLTSVTLTGTTVITLTGGTWSANTSGASVSNSLTIGGNVTIGNVYYLTGTLTYSTGTPVISGTLTLKGACTLETGTAHTVTLHWANVTFGASGTYTLSSDLWINGDMSIATFNCVGTGVVNVNIAGSLISTTGTWSGTNTLIFLGVNAGATWQASTVATHVTINATTGAATLILANGGTITWGTTSKTLLWSAGTVTTTGNTFTISSVSPTLNCGTGLAFNVLNLTTAASSAVTLGSALNCTTLNIACTAGNTVTFSGAFNVAATTLRVSNGTTVSIPAGRTWTVSTNLYINGSDNVTTTLTAATAATFALTYNGTIANQQIAHATLTYVDASAGTALVNYWGTDSNTVNCSIGPGGTGFLVQ